MSDSIEVPVKVVPCPCCGDPLGVPVSLVPAGQFAHITGTEGDCPDCAKAEAIHAGHHQLCIALVGKVVCYRDCTLREVR